MNVKPRISLILVLLVANSISSASAGLISFTRFEHHIQDSSGYNNVVIEETGPVDGALSYLNNSDSTQHSSANSIAYASYGRVKAGVSGFASDNVITASSHAGFEDTLLLSNGGLNGTVGTILMSFYYEYDISLISHDPHHSALGNVGFTAEVGHYSAGVWHSLSKGGPSESYYYTKRDYYGYDYEVGPGKGHLLVSANFIWGEKIDIRYTLGVNGTAAISQNPGTRAYFDIDALHSGYWDGILSVTANGQEVTDFTLTSGSGTDYSRSFVPTADPVGVPEPTSIALLSLGIAGLLYGGRRRSSGI